MQKSIFAFIGGSLSVTVLCLVMYLEFKDYGQSGQWHYQQPVEHQRLRRQSIPSDNIQVSPIWVEKIENMFSGLRN